MKTIRLFGLLRVLGENSSIESHQDIFRRDDHKLWQNAPIKSKLPLTVFLSVANEGREMELWNFKLSDEEYKVLQHKDEKISYGLDRNKISFKSMEYKPKLGEIVLFNAAYLHAAKRVKTGNRLTMSSFIGLIDNSDDIYLELKI